MIMRDYKQEYENRVAFIRQLLADSGAKGIVFGNSGGKDSALVGILCKAACENTVGVIMPCSSRRNYGLDAEDGRVLAEQYGIETRVLDLTPIKETMLKQLSTVTEVTHMADVNIAPRLRMTALYAVAASEGLLVAGTGNRSEAYVGYYTKWGDGAHDFNPISDLTVQEVYAFLRYLDAPLPGSTTGRPMRRIWASAMPIWMSFCSPAAPTKRQPPLLSGCTATAPISAHPSKLTRTA